MPSHRATDSIVTFDAGYLAPRPMSPEAVAFATGAPGNRGAGLFRLVRIDRPAPGMIIATLDPADGEGDSATVRVNPESLANFGALSSSIIAASNGRVSSVLYPDSPVPGAPGLLAPVATGKLTPDLIATAAAAAGIIDPTAQDILRRAVIDGRVTDPTDVPGVIARTWKAMAARGASQADAVRSALSAHFAADADADADTDGQRSESLPGSHALVSIQHGSPMIVVARALNGGPERRVPVDIRALADWPTFQAAVSAASGGQIQLVQPTADQATDISGMPDRLAAKPPTTTGNGAITNNPDGTTIAMSDAISDDQLAEMRRRSDRARHLDLLARTGLGRSALPAVAASPVSAQDAAAREHRDRLWSESPERYANHLMAVAAGQRRDRQLGATALGRSVLHLEQAEDAGYR
jgi:hypothetical protein